MQGDIFPFTIFHTLWRVLNAVFMRLSEFVAFLYELGKICLLVQEC